MRTKNIHDDVHHPFYHCISLTFSHSLSYNPPETSSILNQLTDD